MIVAFTWVVMEMRCAQIKDLKQCMAGRKHSINVTNDLF